MRLTTFSSLLFVALASQSALAWTIKADFDSGEIGTKADRGGDGFSGAGGLSYYSSEQAVNGQSAKLTIQEGSTGYGSWGGEFIFPEALTKGDTVWYQVYTYFPVGFDHYAYGEGGRLKFLRLQTKSASGNNHGYVDLYIDRKNDPIPFKWIYEGAARWKNVGEPSDIITPGRWESYQMRVTFDNIPVSSGGTAEVLVWKNGRLMQHITDTPTLREATDIANRALLFTYWNGGAPKTQSMYVDEITLTTESPHSSDTYGNQLIGGSIPNPPAPINNVRVE